MMLQQSTNISREKTTTSQQSNLTFTLGQTGKRTTESVLSAEESFLISHRTESAREQPPPNSPLKGHHCVWRIAMATADEL